MRETNTTTVRGILDISDVRLEFILATKYLKDVHKAVSIFGSARIKEGHPYHTAAQEIAKQFSDNGYAVFSGGGPGIMEAINMGAYAGTSDSIGLNIMLPFEQCGNAYQDKSYSFKYFFVRKVLFTTHANAFVAMPGGFGTLDELMEVITLVQTGKTKKVPIILVGSFFWTGLLEWFKSTLVDTGVISISDLDLIQVIDDPTEVVKAVLSQIE